MEEEFRLECEVLSDSPSVRSPPDLRERDTHTHKTQMIAYSLHIYTHTHRELMHHLFSLFAIY